MKIIKKSKDNIAYLFTVKKSTDYIFYFINEYYNGWNLQNFEKNYEKKSQLSEKFILNSIYQIISQLDFLYKNKNLYRFVNLENVLINLDMYENKIVKGLLPQKIDYSKISDNEPFTLKFGNLFHFQNIEGTEKIEVQNFMSPEMAEKYKDGENILWIKKWYIVYCCYGIWIINWEKTFWRK